jgi:hypothetical protein
MALGATPARIAAHFLAHAARYAGSGALAGAVLPGHDPTGWRARLPGSVPRVRRRNSGTCRFALSTAPSWAAVLAALAGAEFRPRAPTRVNPNRGVIPTICERRALPPFATRTPAPECGSGV